MTNIAEKIGKLAELYPVISDTSLGQKLLTYVNDDMPDKKGVDEIFVIWVARSGLGDTLVTADNGKTWWEVNDWQKVFSEEIGGVLWKSG